MPVHHSFPQQRNSWNHLQDTIKAAEGLVNAENPNANEIEIMKRQLTDAMVKLVLSVDNEKLKSFVDDLSNLEQKDYTKDSWKQFQTCLLYTSFYIMSFT